MSETHEQVIIDAEHLRLLRLGYFVSAGTTGFFSLFGLFYMCMGIFMGVMLKHIPSQPGAPAPPEFLGWLFGVVGFGFSALFGSAALLKLRAARCLRQRSSRGFCIAIGVLSCIEIPYGTALGVFSFMVLTRPSVIALFEDQREPVTDSG